MPKPQQTPADYIVPLDMNGLQGRMLRLPPPNKARNREILLIYGHHAMLERWWGLAQNFNACGAVTMPDLPGFGGMDSFYKIGKRPTVDAFADYLAAFIKLQYKRRRVTIVGISFGFVVVTRMLQRYPELARRVDFVVSLVGFAHRDDFVFKPSARILYAVGGRLLSTPPLAFMVRHVFLNGPAIRQIYRRLSRSRQRFAEVEPTEFRAVLDFDIKLWQTNDVRTHWATTAEFLRLDNCRAQVPLPVWHVYTKTDYYFKNEIVEQHLRVIFQDCRPVPVEIKTHTPSILATKKEMAVLVPPVLRRALLKG